MACERYEISRKTFYKWRTRFTQARSARRRRGSLPPAAPPAPRVKKALRRRLVVLPQRNHPVPACLRLLLVAGPGALSPLKRHN